MLPVVSSLHTSVVIRAYNEERHLEGLLRRLREQEYGQGIEIIVVDSGSIDRTREIARRHADQVVRIESADFTFGYSLNAGVQHSTGRYVAIISAHALPIDSAWLTHLTAPLGQTRTAMVCGRQLGVAGSKFSEAMDLARTFGLEPVALTPPNFFANNANSALRRELWEAHPFDESLPGLEDVEWIKHWMQQGYRGAYEPRAAVYHIHEETWRQVRRRYYREAVARRIIGVPAAWGMAGELAGEGARLIADLVAAGRRGVLVTKTPEILRFRWERAWGTAVGLAHGARYARSPQQKRDMFFDARYGAVVIRGPGRASFEEIAMPVIKPGEVLIKVAYEGVSGADLEIFDGSLGCYQTGEATYPIVPGHEFSGRIVKTGVNVNGCAEGDRVVVEHIQSCGVCQYCLSGDGIRCADRQEVGVIGRNGGYAEYVVAPARFVHTLPASMDLKAAALCEPAAVVLKGLRRLERLRRPGEAAGSCGVVGAGPIGHLAARILQTRGYRVAVYDQNPDRRAQLTGTGIQTFDSLGDLMRFEIIVEATGDPGVWQTILLESRPGAVLLLIGLPYVRREFAMHSIVAYDKIVIGSVGGSGADFDEAIQVLRTLDLGPFVHTVIPLRDFATAWQLFRTRRHLKVLLCADPDVDGA